MVQKHTKNVNLLRSLTLVPLIMSHTFKIIWSLFTKLNLSMFNSLMVLMLLLIKMELFDFQRILLSLMSCIFQISLLIFFLCKT